MSAQWAYPQVITACAVMLLLAACPIPAPGTGHANSVAGSRTFPETGKTVSGKFLEYWQGHGSLAQLGYPISDQMQERSDINGQTYRCSTSSARCWSCTPRTRRPTMCC